MQASQNIFMFFGNPRHFNTTQVVPYLTVVTLDVWSVKASGIWDKQLAQNKLATRTEHTRYFLISASARLSYVGVQQIGIPSLIIWHLSTHRVNGSIIGTYPDIVMFIDYQI